MTPRALILGVLAALFAAAPAHADGLAGRPGELYSFGAGARALGMGSGHTAVVQDVTSIYYNPAGLGLLPGREVTFLRAQLFGGASYDYIAYAQSKKKRLGGWGLELIRLGVGGAGGRDEFNNETGDFDYSEMSLGFATGWRGLFHPKMSLGLKGKMLRRSLGSSSDQLIGLDLGLQYGPWLEERLMLGAIVQNAVSLSMGDTDDKLGLVVRAGAAYHVSGPLSLAADISQSGEFRLGTEYSFGIASLRVGMMDKQLSFGGGLKLRKKYSLDLALVNHPTFGMSQRFSVGYRFGSALPKKGARKPAKMAHFADEYLKNAQAELRKRNYLRASRDLDTALGIDPKIGGGEWKIKARRLRKFVKAIELSAHADDQEEFKEEVREAYIAYQSVEAYLANEEDRAALLAHAALGTAPKSPTYRRLLETMTRLTGRSKEREQIREPGRLAALKMQQAVTAIYGRRFAVAAELLRQALWLDPNDGLAWTRLGSAYFAMGDQTRAKAAWDQALRLNPGDAKLRGFMRKAGMTP